jgi:hypothetical protein
MMIPYQERLLESYMCHTFANKSKVRSIFGQGLLFHYTVRKIVERLVVAGTVEIFSGQYTGRALVAVFDVSAHGNSTTNDDGVSTHRATTC